MTDPERIEALEKELAELKESLEFSRKNEDRTINEIYARFVKVESACSLLWQIALKMASATNTFSGEIQALLGKAKDCV